MFFHFCTSKIRKYTQKVNHVRFAFRQPAVASACRKSGSAAFLPSCKHFNCVKMLLISRKGNPNGSLSNYPSLRILWPEGLFRQPVLFHFFVKTPGISAQKYRGFQILGFYCGITASAWRPRAYGRCGPAGACGGGGSRGCIPAAHRRPGTPGTAPGTWSGGW